MSHPNPERDERVPERQWIELRTQHAFSVRPDPYIETVEYMRADLFNTHYEGLMRAALLREQNATTRMRDLCVDRVRDHGFHHYPNCRSVTVNGVCSCGRLATFNKLITELESLTLE